MGRHILLIEDEMGLVLAFTDRLESEGYLVTHRVDGMSGYETAMEEGFDLIILDLMLPNKNGFDICRDLRQKGLSIPILMLTARDLLSDKVVGLKLGADDYLTKPFETLELLARIEALLRRTANLTEIDRETYRFGEVFIDFRKVIVTKAGIEVALSAKLYQLLVYFVNHRQWVLSRDQLLDAVWG